MTHLYDLSITQQDGTILPLSDFKGTILLIVNTATGCGLTPQYEGLQKLYDTYHEQGFTILDFPCNQFNEQASGTDQDINDFCTLHYNTTFPRFQKTDVNGPNQSPLFAYLKKAKGGLFNREIKWNFTKFLVDQNGRVVARYAPQTTPNRIAKDIQKLLQ